MDSTEPFPDRAKGMAVVNAAFLPRMLLSFSPSLPTRSNPNAFASPKPCRDATMHVMYGHAVSRRPLVPLPLLDRAAPLLEPFQGAILAALTIKANRFGYLRARVAFRLRFDTG